MAIKDLHQIPQTFDVFAGMEKVVLLYPYRSEEGLPEEDPYPEKPDSMLASADTRGISKVFSKKSRQFVLPRRSRVFRRLKGARKTHSIN
jgi:hypothetical protein